MIASALSACTMHIEWQCQALFGSDIFTNHFLPYCLHNVLSDSWSKMHRLIFKTKPGKRQKKPTIANVSIGRYCFNTLLAGIGKRCLSAFIIAWKYPFQMFFFRPSLHYYFRNISISRLPHKWYQITIENNSNKTFQKPNEKKNQSKPNGKWTIFRSCENDSIKEYSHHILMDSFLSVLIKITSYTNHRVKCIFQTAPTKNVPETRTNFNVRSSPRYEEMRKNKTTKNIGIETKHKYQAMKRIIAWNRQPKLCTFLLRNTFSFFRMLILLFIFVAPDPFLHTKSFTTVFFLV